jgi:hypothetical protein
MASAESFAALTRHLAHGLLELTTSKERDMPRLQVPLDGNTVEGLKALGKDLVQKESARKAFLKDPAVALKKYGISGIDPSKFDVKLVDLLTDKKFERAVRVKDIDAIREYVQEKLGITSGIEKVGIFDFDFDVEVEVEVVAVAVAVFDLALTQIPSATPAQLTKRREIVARAFAKLGKTVG